MSTSLKSTHNEIMPKCKISCKGIWRIQWEYSKRFTNLCTWVFVTDNECFSLMSMEITFHEPQNFIFARTCDKRCLLIHQQKQIVMEYGDLTIIHCGLNDISLYWTLIGHDWKMMVLCHKWIPQCSITLI